MAVALTLERASLQFAAIRVPLRRPAAGPALGPASHAPGDDPEQPPDLLPPPLPPHCAALAAALAAVCALASPALPFAAHVLSADALRVVVPKAHTAAVFKLLRAQQEALGVEVKDVKSHVSLGPLPAAELEAACGAGLAAALLHCGGWHPLGEERLLGASPLAPAPDGAAQACGALTLRVQAVPGDATRLRLLVKAGEARCSWAGLWVLGACLQGCLGRR